MSRHKAVEIKDILNGYLLTTRSSTEYNEVFYELYDEANTAAKRFMLATPAPEKVTDPDLPF